MEKRVVILHSFVSLSIQITTKFYPSYISLQSIHSLFPLPLSSIRLPFSLLEIVTAVSSLDLYFQSPPRVILQKISLINGSPHLKTLDFKSYLFLFLTPSSIILLYFFSSSQTCIFQDMLFSLSGALALLISYISPDPRRKMKTTVVQTGRNLVEGIGHIDD